MGVVAVILLASLGITIYTIVARNLGYSTDDWALKLPEMMLGWMTFLGMGALVATRGHVAADMVVSLLAPGGRRAAHVAWTLVAAGVLGFIMAGAISIVQQTYAIEQTDSELFDMPRWLLLLPLPVGLAVAIIHLLLDLVVTSRPDRGDVGSVH